MNSLRDRGLCKRVQLPNWLEYIFCRKMKPFVARKPKHLQTVKVETENKSTAGSPTAIPVTGRAVIIKELIDTERTFLSDLLVIQEVFISTDTPLPKSDHRLLFGNLDSVIFLSDTLYRGWRGNECFNTNFDYNTIVKLR